MPQDRDAQQPERLAMTASVLTFAVSAGPGLPSPHTTADRVCPLFSLHPGASRCPLLTRHWGLTGSGSTRLVYTARQMLVHCVLRLFVATEPTRLSRNPFGDTPEGFHYFRVTCGLW